jgi:hypothetical protein
MLELWSATTAQKCSMTCSYNSLFSMRLSRVSAHLSYDRLDLCFTSSVDLAAQAAPNIVSHPVQEPSFSACVPKLDR